MDVLIFEDDTDYAGLLREIVTGIGATTDVFYDGRNALKVIRNYRPRLVILDIMLPGMDGLSILKAMRNDPELETTEAVVLSAKSFEEDRRNALACGARAFLSKSKADKLGIETLIKSLLCTPQPAGIISTPLPTAPFRAHILGARGPREAGAGPHPTSGVMLQFGGRTVFLDAGTGLQHLKTTYPPIKGEAALLLTHYHADHVDGLEYLFRALSRDCALKIVGPQDTEGSLKKLLDRTMKASGASQLRVDPYLVSESDFWLWRDIKVSCVSTLHPGATLAYRLHYRDKSLVYAPCNELNATEEGKPSEFDAKFIRFIQSADVLVHDAHYLDKDFAGHEGEGHSCPSRVSEAAHAAQVGRVVLFHAASTYSAQDLKVADRRMQPLHPAKSLFVQVEYAWPGMAIDV